MHKGNALDALHRSSYSATQPPVPSVVLKVEGLVKIYGKRRVVDGVSFHVNRGEIVGLLGPNGAGKTTSFRMTCGLINSNGGLVYLGPHEVTNWPMYRRSREGGMGYLPQDKSVFQKLSVQNNLLGVMEMLGIPRPERKRRCDELLEKFRLTHLRRNLGGGLSGGERRRLEIARALVSDPKIILLDEPFAAVDPITVTGIQEIIRQLAEEGISILITDHSVQDTLQITQRSYVIQAGRVLCHGTPAEVLGNPEARKVYFGENVSVSQLHGSTIIMPSSPAAEPMPESVPVLEPEPELDAMPGDDSQVDVPLDEVPVTPNSKRLAVPERRERLRRIEPEKPVGPVPQVFPSASAVSRAPRPMGRRLVPSVPAGTERPLIRSSTSASASIPAVTESSPASAPESAELPAGASGIIRTLGAMIWGK